MNTQPKWTHAYRSNALTLNPDLVAKVDREIASERAHANEAALAAHWIFADQTYSKALSDLVHAVRKGALDASACNCLSDRQLAAQLLLDHGLWDTPEPRTIWEKTRFLSRFLYLQLLVWQLHRFTLPPCLTNKWICHRIDTMGLSMDEVGRDHSVDHVLHLRRVDHHASLLGVAVHRFC